MIVITLRHFFLYRIENIDVRLLAPKSTPRWYWVSPAGDPAGCTVKHQDSHGDATLFAQLHIGMKRLHLLEGYPTFWDCPWREQLQLVGGSATFTPFRFRGLQMVVSPLVLLNPQDPVCALAIVWDSAGLVFCHHQKSWWLQNPSKTWPDLYQIYQLGRKLACSPIKLAARVIIILLRMSLSNTLKRWHRRDNYLAVAFRIFWHFAWPHGISVNSLGCDFSSHMCRRDHAAISSR